MGWSLPLSCSGLLSSKSRNHHEWQLVMMVVVRSSYLLTTICFCSCFWSTHLKVNFVGCYCRTRVFRASKVVSRLYKIYENAFIWVWLKRYIFIWENCVFWNNRGTRGHSLLVLCIVCLWHLLLLFPGTAMCFACALSHQQQSGCLENATVRLLSACFEWHPLVICLLLLCNILSVSVLFLRMDSALGSF